MPETTLIIPAYNEAKRLPWETLKDFAVARKIRFVLVNDGSTDDTGARMAALASEAPEYFSAISLSPNQGKAEAVRQGMLAVSPDAAFAGYWDADLATPLEELFAFQRAFEEDPAREMVCGSRVKRMGAAIRRRLFRHLVGRAVATAISLILRLPTYDTQCGAKLFRTSCIGALFREPFHTRWLFDVEIFQRYQKLRGKEGALKGILELPLCHWSEAGGSALGIRNAFGILRELWCIARMGKKEAGGRSR